MRGVSTPAAEREAATGDTADAVEAAGHFRIYLGCRRRRRGLHGATA